MKGIVVVVIFVLAGILYASAGNDSLGITNVPGQKSEVVAVGLRSSQPLYRLQQVSL